MFTKKTLCTVKSNLIIDITMKYIIIVILVISYYKLSRKNLNNLLKNILLKID